jgi:NitT/TauT family transport system permease protein
MFLTSTYVRLRRSFGLVDVLVLAAGAALLAGLLDVAREWGGVLRPQVEIDLSPFALPRYAFFSLVRGFTAYALSLAFTLAYGYTAAYRPRAEKVLLPLLDILQSIPVLGFLPGLVLALVALFPGSNIGLELAAVLMIFTGQAWNMTFSFYNSLRAIPPDLREASRVYRFGRWQRVTRLELPYAAMGLVWNSMMSMAGGWFFLMINEAFVLGDHDFRLPGIGSYMSVAVHRGDVPAMVFAIVAMTLMIIAVDQLFWRPIVAWAQKFTLDETGRSEEVHSFVLDLLRRSRLLDVLHRRVVAPAGRALERRRRRAALIAAPVAPQRIHPFVRRGVSLLVAVLALAGVFFGAAKLVILLAGVGWAEWGTLAFALGCTGLRVAAAVTLGTVIMIPLGVAIGRNPRLSRILQPVVQIAASFPAPMLFPLVILALAGAGIGIQTGAVLLMLLGTQWYILFNVIAAAMALPEALFEAGAVFRVGRWKQWTTLILPGIFPGLVTGWVTATGGAWNASIVAEYVHFGDRVLVATGLGSAITTATDRGDFGALAAGVVLMACSVVLLNRFFWRRLYRLAENRYSLQG